MTKHRERIWLSKPQCAALIGKSEEFLRQKIIPGLKSQERRRSRERGQPWAFDAVAVVRVFVEIIQEQDTEAVLLSGDPSVCPHLQRLRAAKAALAELELAERQGVLVEVNRVRAMLGRWGAHLRSAGKWMRVNAPKAAERLDQAIDRCSEEIELERQRDAAK